MPSGLTGLSRTNSIVSNRSSLASPTRNDMPSTPTGSRFGRESVSSSPKRPGSVHSEATILQHTRENGRPSTPPAPASASNTRTEESPSRQPSSLHKRSSSALGWEDQNSGSPLTSRTMDSKRWSPTKASWLESALNRPESPRHMKQPSQQSPWSRERQSRGSVDFGRRGSFKEVTPVGLMRSTAPGSHFKKPSVSSIPDPPSSPSKIKEAESEGIHEAESEPIKEVASETTTEANPDPASAKDNDRPSSEDLPDSPSSIENASQQEPEPTTVAEDTAKDKPESSSPKVHSRFSSISREPAAPKPTSQSPVVDFRGNLRRREVAKDSSPKEEPEFKNVFGKLRRTQTSNYVAPDELKNNILRGKAALNVTGGPKKTQRVDEFKESILKQKEAMKAGGGSLRRNTAGEDDAPGKPAAAVPEAIAKRNHMATASISKSARSPDAPSSPSTKNPEAPDHAQDHQESPLSPLSNELPADSEPLQPPPADNTDPEQSERRVEDPVSPNNENGDESKTAPLDEKPDERSVEEKPTGSIEGGIKPVRDSPSGDAAEAIKAPAVTEGLSTKGKLAGRINPALAGLLSRGPPAAASAGPKASAIGESTSVTPQNTSAAPLTHMTKGRAKGPKRRLPRATAADTTSPREGGEPRSPSPTTTSLDTEQTQEVRSTFDKSVDDTSSPALPEPQRGPPLARETTPEQAPFSFTDEPSKVRNLPEAMFKDQSAELRQSSSQSTLAEGKNNQPGDGGVGQAVANQEDNTPSEGALSPMPSSVGSPSGTSGGLPESQEDVLPSAPESPQEQMPSPSTARSKPSRPFHGYQEDAFLSEPAMPPKAVPSPLNSPSEPGQGVHENQENTVPPAPAVPHNEVGSPLASPSETIRGSRDLYSSPSPSPLKTNTKENRMPSMDPQKSTPTKFGVGGPRDMSLRGKPLPTPPAPLEITSDKRFDQPPPSPVPSSRVPSSSLISDAAQSKEVISSFFNTFPSPNARVDIDPQSILTSQSDGPKIRTLKKQIWEITGDVKRQDLPPSQEYILYEGSMYLLVHVFEVDSATRAEVQLWCGDDVPEAAVDDAQSFARKVARENGCKLELLKQGKETARFIRALGGILITRRGFNSRSTSSSLYMLCGRRHMGEMVFDEVDLSRRNLCSGYPFVISAPFGNLYLWKGKGSGAEEVGAARLIGIDLGLTGEIEEVAEGEEPESFFENFPDYKGSGDYVRSEYWQLKPNHARFQTRLLRIDHELGQRSFWMRRPGTSSPVTRPNDTLQEIVPFRYKDLTSRGIFILDIFFEIYV